MRSTDVADDRTARARIRDAAITRFAAEGVSATSVRAIAAEAGVSAGLVIHHFGSKEALRRACDEHVASLIRSNKHEGMTAGASFDPLAAMRDARQDIPLTKYLARTLIDGTPQVAALIDELVADAADYMAEGVEAGALRPSAYPSERAAVLTLWSLGALVLHEHVERVLGVDLTRDPSELADTAEGAAYLGPVLELFTDGLLSDEVAGTLRSALVDRAAPTSTTIREQEST
ncbi:MAG: TetR family transcriptional regulator [Actinomycetota bacterium]|nr:TetR family transcriptional regulator [Actinomycetota bacterium]